MENNYNKTNKLFPGTIITKDLASYFSAIVLEVNEKGIFCESNENKYIPRFTFMWEGDYMEVANVKLERPY